MVHRLTSILCWLLAVWWTAPTGWADETTDRLIDEAAQELTYFNFDLAYGQFEGVLAELEDEAGSAAWQRATFGLALSAQSRTPATAGLVEQARVLYERLLEVAPDSAFAPRARLNLGRIQEMRDYGGDVVDLDAARGHYRLVLETWPQLDIADEAALRYADTFWQQFKEPERVQQGVDFAVGWVEGRADRPLASAIWEAIGDARLIILEDYRGAVDALVRADELGLLEQNRAGDVYWNIATLSDRRLGEIDTAVRYYQRIIVETPRSGRAFESQLHLRRLAEQHPGRDIEVPEISQLLPIDGRPPPAAQAPGPPPAETPDP